MTDKCNDCRFFREDGFNFHKPHYCVRRAPDGGGGFSSTSPEGWCGEFVPLEEAEQKAREQKAREQEARDAELKKDRLARARLCEAEHRRDRAWCKHLISIKPEWERTHPVEDFMEDKDEA